jgi:putative resolvase
VGEGVHYQTAWRWWRDGKLPVPARQTETGTILVDVPVPGCAAGAVLYAGCLRMISTRTWTGRSPG